MTPNVWKTIFGVVAAVASFALATDLHPDFTFSPAISFLLGAILVGLAVVNPATIGSGGDE